MKLTYSSQLTIEQQRSLCTRPWTGDASVRTAVESICLNVKRRGDDSLKEYGLRFDAARISDFRVSDSEMDAAQKEVPSGVRMAIEQAARNIRTFHSAQLKSEERIQTETGVLCWREQRPIDAVGLYVPAGSAPLPSTVLMLGIPALTAGCRRIIICSPPTPNGAIDPVVLAAANFLGISEIYKVGGAQAVAAMAYGTQSIPRVDKIFGPGNQYVTEAKRFVAADPDGAAIDLLAGPSELLIIADDTADAKILAADLLSQAEHDPKSQVALVTPSEPLAKATLDELGRQLTLLPRNTVAAMSLEASFAVVVRSVDEAISFANLYAPEHLIINTREPETIASGIQNAGSVFLGSYAPVTAGDYASGTNHTLPTGGTARRFSGVSVESFQKSITFQYLSREGLRRLSPVLIKMAETEGLQAHARAVTIRLMDDKES